MNGNGQYAYLLEDMVKELPTKMWGWFVTKEGERSEVDDMFAYFDVNRGLVSLIVVGLYYESFLDTHIGYRGPSAELHRLYSPYLFMCTMIIGG